jgi:hypothetical protein
MLLFPQSSYDHYQGSCVPPPDAMVRVQWTDWRYWGTYGSAGALTQKFQGGTMKKIMFSGLALGLVLAAAPFAMADTYSFSYYEYASINYVITLTGDLTTDVNNTITNVFNATYSDTGTGISGATTLDNTPADLTSIEADNKFYPAGPPFLDAEGMLLNVGGAYVNIWFCFNSTGCGINNAVPGGLYAVDEYDNHADLESGYPDGVDTETFNGLLQATELSGAATPEPSSWLLMGSGMLVLMGIAYRRRLSLGL